VTTTVGEIAAVETSTDATGHATTTSIAKDGTVTQTAADSTATTTAAQVATGGSDDMVMQSLTTTDAAGYTHVTNVVGDGTVTETSTPPSDSIVEDGTLVTVDLPQTLVINEDDDSPRTNVDWYKIRTEVAGATITSFDDETRNAFKRVVANLLGVDTISIVLLVLPAEYAERKTKSLEAMGDGISVRSAVAVPVAASTGVAEAVDDASFASSMTTALAAIDVTASSVTSEKILAGSDVESFDAIFGADFTSDAAENAAAAQLSTESGAGVASAQMQQHATATATVAQAEQMHQGVPAQGQKDQHQIFKEHVELAGLVIGAVVAMVGATIFVRRQQVVTRSESQLQGPAGTVLTPTALSAI